MTLLVHLNGIDEAKWVALLRPLLGGMAVVRRGDAFDPRDIAYVLAWRPDADAFAGLENLKAILSYGAGVDALLAHPGLPKGVPIVRFVDPDLTARMRDYVVAEILAHSRLETQFRAAQNDRRWQERVPPRAEDLNVGVMGLGVLGQAALKALSVFDYERFGWARSQTIVAGVQTFYGPDGLDAFLSQIDILVCLLPLTPETRGILNRRTFSRLRRGILPGGPVVINAARGGHQIEADLVAALEDGTLGAASLDVFMTEPLPRDNPLWGLCNCRITPHIAAVSDLQAGAAYFTRVIRDHEKGEPLHNLVDWVRGY